MTARPAQAPAAQAAHGLEVVRERLWEAVTVRDEDAATATVLDALDHGVDVEAVLIDVIAPVQERVGAEWAANHISVAQEHAVTAINDRVITAVSRHPASQAEARLGRVIVACVDGEWHAMPARLLAEVLAMRGWRVDFLGAQVPTPHLIADIHETAPDVVALSSSIATRLPIAHAMISACQAAGVPVLAGGPAFGPDGRYARLLGADAWAPDAHAAADRLRGGLPRRATPPTHQPSESLPHLADGEYVKVTESATALVRGTMAGLEERFPALRTYTERQRQHTAEDVAHIVDFLGAALYVDDELFTSFMAWTADILTARNVPAHSLHVVLDLLAEQLRDLPRAVRVIHQARPRIDSSGVSSHLPHERR